MSESEAAALITASTSNCFLGLVESGTASESAIIVLIVSGLEIGVTLSFC